MVSRVQTGLEARLRDAVDGEIHFDAFTRGRYATDASHYQIMPTGVVVPRTMEAAVRAFALAREEGISATARGGGTSQSGQTINRGLVVDGSKHLRRILGLDLANRRCTVEPGIVLDDLNRQLKPHGLWFPVDVSTASRATIGGMVGNNSCGGRSLRYGTTRDNVISIQAVLADGTPMHFGELETDPASINDPRRRALTERLLAIGAREADEVAARFPKVQRRVGGYNVDALDPRRGRINLAHVLVGSEGTLAYSTAVELKLSPLLGRRAVGVCHFGSFRAAMEAAQHLVALGPIAIELVDATMIALAGAIAMFQPVLQTVIRGEPAALLLVEFAEDEAENLRRLQRLDALIGDLGLGFDRNGAHWGGVVEVLDPALQASITDLRTSGLNIMMSMKAEAKPVSFVEDCAVPLEHLADYTDRLTQIFERHGTHGTWYAHASEGCLHVRPVLNLRLEKDVRAMRAIAEEAFEAVRAYKGSHSGEHGDGIVRSEFHEAMFGSRVVRAFEAVKDAFDPEGVLNPGKIVHPPRFDDRSLLRYAPGYAVRDFRPALDWSDYPGAAGGLQGAVEMCNNNGACRALAGGVMCPSYRATRDEQHVTRGRANSLRLALSGQLGPDILASDAMSDTMQLCVSCKACLRECPAGVDMARMKIEVQAARAAKHGFSLRDRLVGFLPRYAAIGARLAPLLNLRDRLPPLARLSERLLGPQRAPDPAGLAPRSFPSSAHRIWSRERSGGRAVGRHVQRRLRARDDRRRHHDPGCFRLSRAYRAPGDRVAPALLRAHLPVDRRCRPRPRGAGAQPGRTTPVPAAPRSRGGAGAELPAAVPRRGAGAAAGRGFPPRSRGCLPVRGVHRRGGESRPVPSAVRAGHADRPAAWTLSPEGVWSHGERAGGIAPDPRAYAGDDRVELLRDGRRVRLPGRDGGGVAGDGRVVAAAGDTSSL